MLPYITYNKHRPLQTYIGKEICSKLNITQDYIKTDLSLVYKQEPSLRQLIDRAPLFKDRKYISINVKVQELKRDNIQPLILAGILMGRHILNSLLQMIIIII